MSGQGYHFVIPRDEAIRLVSLNDPDLICQEVGEWDAESEHVHGGYKEWDVLLRCLSDGTFNPRGGTYPLNVCFFGGHLLVTNGSIVNLVVPEQVRDAASALTALDVPWFRSRFTELFSHEFDGAVPDSALEYYCDCFEGLKRYYLWVSGRKDYAIVFYTDDCLNYFWESDN